jgi:hypothetical protein
METLAVMAEVHQTFQLVQAVELVLLAVQLLVQLVV